MRRFLLAQALFIGHLSITVGQSWNNPFLISKYYDSEIKLPEYPELKEGDLIGTFDYKDFDGDILISAESAETTKICNTVYRIEKKDLFLNVTLDFDTESGSYDIKDCFFSLGVTDVLDCTKDNCKAPGGRIVNVNDLKPTYLDVTRNYELYENITNDKLFNIRAKDDEFKGELTIYIQDHQDDENFPFYFKSVQVEEDPAIKEWQFWVRSVDFEMQRSYYLPIILQDAEDEYGNIMNNTELTINIEVRDINDNPPQWIRRCSFKEIKENDDKAEIFSIYAKDVDATFDHEVDYKISSVINGNSVDTDFADKFEIVPDEEGGVIVKTNVTLDREDPTIGSFSMFDFEITIKEQNCLSECDGEPLHCFMRLEDVNDNTPKFGQDKYEVTISENYIQQLNLRILVTDLDQYEMGFNRFTLSIPDDTARDNFMIIPEFGVGVNSSFDIQAVKESDLLDYETRQSYSFEIMVTDENNETMHSSAMVEITLEDENDNEPKFVETSYTKEFNEDLSGPETPCNDGKCSILTVEATDDDLSDKYGNKSLIYEVKSAPRGLQIDRKTGEIFVNQSTINLTFDYEEQTSHSFKVIAKDDEGAGYSVEADVTFILKDVNDNAPEFIKQGEYQHHSMNNTFPANNAVIKLQGIDLDTLPENAEFEFGIEMDDDFPFELKEDTLFLTKSLLNPDIKRIFNYNATITDKGGLKSTIMCTVNVSDVNDNPPVYIFPPVNYRFWVNENATAGELKNISGYPVYVETEDSDVDENYNKVTYTIEENNADNIMNEFFKINLDGSQGKFQLLQDFGKYNFSDPESDEIMLSVTAEDGVNTDKIQFTLKLMRNYPPYFEGKSSQHQITEEDPGTKIELAQARDQNNEDHPDDEDWPMNEICYYIMEGDIKNLFNLEKETNILTSDGVDRDCAGCSSYVLTIAATNECDSKPSTVDDVDPEGLLTVTITVRDVNDEPPQFLQQTSFASVLTTDNVDTTISTVLVHDPDTSDFTSPNRLSMDIVNLTTSEGAQDLPTNNPFRLSSTVDVNNLTQTFSIIINFNPQSTMKGFFQASLVLTDSAAEPHAVSSNIKIVMISPEHVCNFRFTGNKEEFEIRRDVLTEVFNFHFKDWLFTVDRITQDDTSEVSEKIFSTTLYVIGHFVEPQTFEPITELDAKVEFQNVLGDLYTDLYSKDFILLDFYNPQPAQSESMSVGLMILIVLTSVFGMAAFFLLVTYWIRTRNLERKVKAMETTAVVEDNSEQRQDKITIAGFQENLPGTNEFAEQGANPFWQAAMESNDFEEDFQFGDNESESSGDSILIGVEDQKDFADNQDLDMELYSRVTKRYRTLDDYQANDIDEMPGSSNQEMGVFAISGSGQGGGNPLYRSDSEQSVDL